MLLVLPTIPRSINVAFVNQSAVDFRWLPPTITGTQTHVVYDVDCRKPCDNDDDNECVDKECGNGVTYLPYKEGLDMTQVMITNLSSFVNYTFKIYAKNRVSEVAKRRHDVEGNFAVFIIRTNGSSKLLSCGICAIYCEIIIISPANDLTQVRHFYIAVNLICFGFKPKVS